MERCKLCSENEIYDVKYKCGPCDLLLCVKHKLTHEREKNRRHNFENLRLKVSYQQIIRIAINISREIEMDHTKEGTIINETSDIISKIG